MPYPVDVSPSTPTRWRDRLFVLVQYALPHHFLSSLMYRLTRIGWPPLKNLLIRGVIRHYDVDLTEAAVADLDAYPTFNAFFTRALREGARPLPDEPTAILCPADGQASQAGEITGDRIFQAKGHDFSVEALLGGDRDWSQRFVGGRFATVYLSPRDYHRVHMPYAGTLRRMIHIPGRLFSVSPLTTEQVPGLFARNERVACLFDTPVGPMAVVLVGAIFVAGIETVWAGTVTPASRRISTWGYGQSPEPAIRLARGAELGRFNMGSTVILLFGPGSTKWSEDLTAGRPVRMGDTIGHVLGEETANSP